MVIPTVGTLLFLSITPQHIALSKRYFLLAVVFGFTYVLPLLMLCFLKAIRVIQSLKVASIKERKIPLFFAFLLFYFLARILWGIPDFRILALLFYGADLAIIFTYLLFFFRIKASLHVMAISSLVAFLFVFGSVYPVVNTLLLIPIFILLTGIVASARLHLKAHTQREVYLGFAVGFSCQLLVALLEPVASFLSYGLVAVVTTGVS